MPDRILKGGPRGPVPKRPEQRRRRNKESVPEVAVIPRALDMAAAPLAGEDWHATAKLVYESLLKSGQAVFYEPSDYAIAFTVCEILSRQLDGEKLNANAIAVVMSVLGSLLATEGDRRRARLILEHGDAQEAPASVALMAKYRKAAAVK